ncbi:MAG TPA: hypothetical protein VEC36_08540 [Patescibacteria group bacterium]|nr:hypothetical protein [Patescibacteria group bacterium]
MKYIILYFTLGITLLGFLLDIAILRDARRKKILPTPEKNRILLKLSQYLLFELEKIALIAIGLAASFLLAAIVRGPAESSVGEWWPTTIYTFDIAGKAVLFISPFIITTAIAARGVKNRKLHPVLYLSFICTLIPMYFIFILVVLFKW